MDTAARGLAAKATAHSKLKTLGASPRMVLWGDSLMMKEKNAQALTGFSYNAGTGVATCTLASHGLYPGQIVFIASHNLPALCFYDLPISVVDTNNFTVQLAAGLSGFPVDPAEIFVGYMAFASGDYPGSWLNCDRPNVVRVVACVGDSVQTIVAKIGQVLAANPSVVRLRGGTNNRNTDTPAAVAALLEAACAQLTDDGVAVILHTIPPSSTITAAQGAWTVDLNDLLREIPLSVPGVVICDDWAATVDPASAVGAGLATYFTTDTLHFTSKAAKAIARHPQGLQAAYDRLAQTVNKHPKSIIEGYDATNNPTGDDACANGLLNTATGGTTGSGITGITASTLSTGITGMGAAAVTSVVAAAVGNAQRMTGTPAANGDIMSVTTGSMHSRVTAGELRRGVCHIKTSGIPASAAAKAIYLHVRMQVGGVTYTQVRALYSAQAGTTFDQADIDMDFETEPFVIPAGLTSLTLRAQIEFSGAGNGTAVTMDVSQFGLQQVPEE